MVVPVMAAAAAVQAAGQIASSITTAKAARAAQQLQNRIYNDSKINQTPFISGGTQASFKLQNLLGLRHDQPLDEYWNQAAPDPSKLRAVDDSNYGSLLKEFTGEDLENEPGYQFRLDEGNKAINSNLASRGSYFSGAAMKALDKYNSDYASTEYQNAFNRDTTNKNTIYSMLSGTANAGQGAASTLAGIGQNYANASSDLMGTEAAATANGIAGVSNSITSAMGSGMGSGNTLGSIYGGTNQVSPSNYTMPLGKYYNSSTGINWNAYGR